MWRIPTVGLTVVLALAAGILAGCATGGGASLASDASSFQETRPAHEAALRSLVRSELEAAQRKTGPSAAEVHSYKPYYFKESSGYPEGPDAFTIVFVETESKVVPLEADVTMAKLRFVTEVTRDRAAARSDGHFVRELGSETISYELRNGAWRRTASLYVAEDLREMQGGEWVPVKQQPRSDYALPAERKGFFRRTMNRLRIGDNDSTTER